jgi:Na+-transporting NADH:ubiquinone oxidoreductase subunit B
MKFLHTAFQNAKAPFEEGGKFEKYNKALTAIDAFETLMFTPEEVTHTGAHIRDGIDLKRTMSIVILAMVPCLLFGMYNAGYQHFSQLGVEASFWEMFQIGLVKVLPIVVVSYGVGLGIEFGFAMYKGHSVEEGYLVTGMLIPLIVPVDIPLWMLAVSVAFAVVFCKEVFGGTGMNILNVALTSRAFLFFAYPTYMSGDKIWVHDGMTNDAISGATILGDLSGMKDGIVKSADGMVQIYWGKLFGFGHVPWFYSRFGRRNLSSSNFDRCCYSTNYGYWKLENNALCCNWCRNNGIDFQCIWRKRVDAI